MSRRISLQLKNPIKKSKSKVKFSDELVFLDCVKGNDVDHIRYMLRRASLKMDLNKVHTTGLTPLHQAVLDNSVEVVLLLLESKANVNSNDEDTWTPLHAACAMGHYDVAK
jgi:ankyrin repeat protein